MQIGLMTALLLDRVYELESESFANPWGREDLEESFNNPAYHFFVCRDNAGQVVGYICYYQVRDEAFVTSVCVTKDARRQGAGRMLLRRAEQSARGDGASFLSLEVRSQNEPAIALYESEDFEVEGVRRKYYSDPEDDAYIMTKRFSQNSPDLGFGKGSVLFEDPGD